ncbi:MAG: ubiquitin conjugating enzyme E2 [Amphiamblys sp. WSBS2006]|nr:MAG: ubiquitin conjugating enzyme E2 [Amphiamblys sp. WSBS2006]
MKHFGIVLLFAALSVSCIGETTFSKRINKEIKNIRKEPTSLLASITLFGEDTETEDKQASPISIVQVEENNLFKWKATMKGPEGTLFEGGEFKIDFTLPEDYPFAPPKIKFTSEMFHPNIYEDGSICLNILKEDWHPAQTMFSTLLCIQSLLNNPNMEDPAANTEADKLFRTDKEEYARRVRATFGRTKPDSTAYSGSSDSLRDGNPAEGGADVAREEKTEEAFD